MIWRWLARSPRKQRKKAFTPQRRTILSLEALETRDCPAAPAIAQFQAFTYANHVATLTGMVIDEAKAGIVVSFSGAFTGTATTNSSGQFSVTTTAAVLGTINAIALDAEGLTGSGSTTVYHATPSITSFSLTHGPNRKVTITGHVNDITDPGGRVVMIAGGASGTVTTNSNGDFTVTLTATALGDIQASAVNAWGQASNVVHATLNNTAPSITAFGGTEGPDRMWTFSGSVSDESPEGLVVTFGGIPSLEGKTATVHADGTYSITVQLAVGEEGTAWAQVTDWWGAVSAMAYFVVDQTD